MPRFVRPAWITIRTDGGTDRETGPRTRDGWTHGSVRLRTPAGTVSERITLAAGGQADDGAGVLMIDIPAGFVGSVVTRVEAVPGATRPAERRYELLGPCLVAIRPARKEG